MNRSYYVREMIKRVRMDGLYLQNVVKQNKKICMVAVNQNGLALQFAHKQDEEICKAAIKNDYRALRFVNGKFKTLAMYRFAVGVDGRALQFVNRKKEDICIIALKNTAGAARWITHLTPKMVKIIRNYNPEELVKFPHNQNRRMCYRAVTKDGLLLRHFLDTYKTLKICHAAVKNNPFAMRYVPERHVSTLKWLAVRINGLTLQTVLVSERCYDLCYEAVRQNGDAIIFSPYQTKCIGLAAVRSNYQSIKHISHTILDNEICSAAFTKCPNAIEYIPGYFQTEEMCIGAMKFNRNLAKYVRIVSEKIYVFMLKKRINLYKINSATKSIIKTVICGKKIVINA